MNRGLGLIWLIVVCLLSACSVHRADPPPVVEGWHVRGDQQQWYRVQSGDTLYAIAWTYGLDYHALAKSNGLTSPYTIQKGAVLRLEGQAPVSQPQQTHVVKQKSMSAEVHRAALKRTVTKPSAPAVVPDSRTFQHAGIRWQWPVRGKMLHAYDPKTMHKGIDIGAKTGTAIQSAASGLVVYSGSGLRGYGRLIIVKHNSAYLSAYAYNKRLLVKEGDHVKMGQTIAEMGSPRAGGPAMVQFQIRHHGKPVNPLLYLKA